LQEYREKVVADPPDIALLNMVVPGGRSLEMVSSPPEANPFPVLMMASHGDEKTAVEAMKAGALDYVVKSPQAFAVMPRILSRALDRWQLIQGRRRAEEALKAGEAQYRLLAEHTTDFVWLMDMALRPTYQSPSAEKLTGFTQQEIMDLPLEKRVTAGSFKLATAVFLEELPRIEADPGYNPIRILELEYCCKDGTTAWAENKFSVIRDPGGKAVSILGEARDVTERKHVEEVLKDSEAKYRLLAENMVDGVWLLDMNLKLIYCSPSSEKQSGFTVQEIMEMSLEQYFTPESLKVVAEAFLEAMPKVEADPDYNPVLTLELEFYKKDGTAFWAESKFSVIRDRHGKPVSILGLARDITERKRIEAALIESEEKYRVVVENSMESIYIAVDGMIKFSNNRTAVLSGYSQEELVSIPFREFIHPDDLPMVAERHSQRLKGGDVPSTYSFRIVCKSGDIKWVELAAVLITWEGKPAILYFLNDVTDRRRLEE